MTQEFENELTLLRVQLTQIMKELDEYAEKTSIGKDYISGSDRNRARFERLRLESSRLMKQISNRIYKWSY